MMPIIEIEGRKFQIKKMDAKTAYKTAKILGTYAVQLQPLMDGIQKGDISAFGKVLTEITDTDIDKLVDFALPQVFEMKSAGLIQVINPATGRYAVQELEDDPVFVGRLVFEAIREGIKGFFQEGRLASMFEGVSIPELTAQT